MRIGSTIAVSLAKIAAPNSPIEASRQRRALSGRAVSACDSSLERRWHRIVPNARMAKSDSVAALTQATAST